MNWSSPSSTFNGFIRQFVFLFFYASIPLHSNSNFISMFICPTYFFIFCHVWRFEPLIAGNSDTTAILWNFSLLSLMVFIVVSVSFAVVVVAADMAAVAAAVPPEVADESGNFCADSNDGVVDVDDEITTNSFVVVFVVSVICNRGWTVPPLPLFNCILKLLLLVEVEWYSMLYSSQSLVQHSKFGSAVGKSMAERWYLLDFFNADIVRRPPPPVTFPPFVRCSCWCTHAQP